MLSRMQLTTYILVLLVSHSLYHINDLLFFARCIINLISNMSNGPWLEVRKTLSIKYYLGCQGKIALQRGQISD